jgi:hypothetical protein
MRYFRWFVWYQDISSVLPDYFLGMLHSIFADMPPPGPAINIFTSSRLLPQKEQCNVCCFAMIILLFAATVLKIGSKDKNHLHNYTLRDNNINKNVAA